MLIGYSSHRKLKHAESPQSQPKPGLWATLPGVQNCPGMRNTALVLGVFFFFFFWALLLYLWEGTQPSPFSQDEEGITPYHRKLHSPQGNYSTTSSYLSVNSVFGRLRVGLEVCSTGLVGASDTIDAWLPLLCRFFPTLFAHLKAREKSSIQLSINLRSDFKQRLA